MKKNNIKKGIFTALLLASPFVTAGTQYPAADFQPKVVYQDNNYQHESSESSSSSAKASFGEKSKADANYPAATFKPEVLYHDTDYKHNSGAGTSKSIPLAMWEEKAEQVAEAKAAESSEDASINPLFAVLVLAVAGFLFLKKSKSSAAVATKATYSDGLTGVAKYLEKKSPKLSGVAKYLELHQPTPKSGVAKYVAKKVVAAKKAASAKTTGVERYMRNKG
ncbi:conserved hypothetical protein [Bathymodiolus platifrons methanotrophic gill symbiont]|uniref:hypothetical protein n=1 Tax=Bathymodiolus platifrons methanotrophic gill symbiont TaxID=113268 RepID=UPI000B6C0E9B|nr:hypothetical protein [Bathymodiolus platifrons methanotrophic gill symbiont]GAW85389.1 conserved hypothetical protein [Bathymodiolus platifrons methanotrophic gill symbiont]GFO75594.1 hypothetical protein BPLS_P2910 [Bathymodiolus platifrons methanotrophic gill symbiont]